MVETEILTSPFSLASSMHCPCLFSMALYLHIYYLRVPRLARCAFSLIQSWRVFVKRFRVPALRVFIGFKTQPEACALRVFIESFRIPALRVFIGLKTQLEVAPVIIVISTFL